MNIADVSPVLNVLYAGKASAQAALRACDGFALAPWVKRAGAPHETHQNYFHIGSGWNYPLQNIPDGHWRTPDFVEVQRAIEPIGLLPTTFGSMASFDGELWKGGGLWDYPFAHAGTHCTSLAYRSATGGTWLNDPTAPSVERECAPMCATTDYLYWPLGVRYTENPPPTYFMPQMMWRKASAALGGAWEQCAANLDPRRDFTIYSWPDPTALGGEAIVLGDGRNDTSYPTVVDLNDFVISRDHGVSFQPLGTAPWRGAYGRKATKFDGGILISGGAYSTSDGKTVNTAFLDECWFSRTPLDLSSFVPVASLPFPCAHHQIGVLTINGVETLGMIGGYNSVLRPNGDPFGTCHTRTASTGFVARRESGFWVEP